MSTTTDMGIDHVAVLIDGTPKGLPFAEDRDEDFVQNYVSPRRR